MSEIQKLKQWNWPVPSNDGTTYEVELFLGSFGSETVSVNGVKVSHKRNWRFKSEHDFQLSRGERAVITISTSLSQLGFPDATLKIDGALIPRKLIALKETLQPETTSQIKSLTKTERRLTILLELCRL